MTEPDDRPPSEEFLGRTWPSVPPAWYAAPPSSEAEKTIKAGYYAKIVEAAVALKKDEAGAERAVRTARDTERAKADVALHQKHYEAMVDVTVGSIQRASDGATFLEKAAASLAALYTGIAALLVATDTPLPLRGVIPTVFLGLAVVLAAYYLAFIGGRHRVAQTGLGNDNPQQDAETRINNLVVWTRAITGMRAHALRAGVLSLAFGLAFMPFAFVRVTDEGVPAALANRMGLPAELVPSPGPTPTPKPTPAWPTPEVIRPAYLTALLYRAQVAEVQALRSAAASKPSAAKPDAAWFDALVWLLAILAGICVAIAYVWRKPFAEPTDGDGAEVPAIR
jgi:hypothetical protein